MVSHSFGSLIQLVVLPAALGLLFQGNCPDVKSKNFYYHCVSNMYGIYKVPFATYQPEYDVFPSRRLNHSLSLYGFKNDFNFYLSYSSCNKRISLKFDNETKKFFSVITKMPFLKRFDSSECALKIPIQMALVVTESVTVVWGCVNTEKNMHDEALLAGAVISTNINLSYTDHLFHEAFNQLQGRIMITDKDLVKLSFNLSERENKNSVLFRENRCTSLQCPTTEPLFFYVIGAFSICFSMLLAYLKCKTGLQ